ncbi:hypothetical protein HYW54_02640 [Candidatus Gottesmanbacteria bacterium]|nr:hypothetical protein [Candidatus Gottesmanbacteria bacterium]
MSVQYVSPKVKDVLSLLGRGVLLSSLFIFPGAGAGLKAILDIYEEDKREKEFREWEKFNLPRLRYILQRLRRQKIIEVSEENGVSIVRLTEKGRLRTLKYKLEEMSIRKQKKWDQKWRIIIYDIEKFKQRQQKAFRRMLKKLNMFQLQKSVYITPYPCDKEVEFLRNYFGVDEGVLYIVAERIEYEDAYKKYFGL